MTLTRQLYITDIGGLNLDREPGEFDIEAKANSLTT